MKFLVEPTELVDAVNWVARSLSTRPIKPELLGIMIDVDTSITLTGSDLETSTKAILKADISAKGKVLVPGRLLAEIARSLPNKPITFTLDGSRVLVTAGTAKFTLPTLSVNEYPSLPELPETAGVIPSDVFAHAVNQVAIAAGKDDSLPTLTGVHIEINKNKITRTLDGSFPPFRHLLPTESVAEATIEVGPLLDSVRRVALVTDKTVPLRLIFNNNSLQLEAGAGEDAQATEELEIIYSGEPINIAFNPQYLTDGLQAIGTPYVQFNFTGSTKPAVLTGKHELSGTRDISYQYLLMPMRYSA